MSRLTVLPHRTARTSTVSWGHWTVSVQGTEPRPVGDVLEDWDYRTVLRFFLDVEVDRESLVADTGLGPGSRVEIVGLVDCRATNRRFRTRVPLDPGTGPFRLEIEVPAGTLADSVVLSAHLVLRSATGPSTPGVAHRPGSRLASGARHPLLLEGTGARFPADAASFRAMGLPTSIWALSTHAESLDSLFAASTRLWINTDLPQTERLLMADTDSRLLRFLQIDIARHLLRVASSLVTDVEDLEDEWEEGSLGDAVSTLAESALHSDLASMMELVRSDPQWLEGLLQECYRPWEVADEGLPAAQ